MNRSFSTFAATMPAHAPALFLQDYREINGSNKNVFRVNASFAKTVSPSDRDLAGMFGDAVNNKLCILAGSVDFVGETQNAKVVSFLARGNTINRGMEEVEGRMTLVAANVFMDNDDESLWTMQGEGKHRRLVQANKEDLSALLNSRLARKAGTMITASTMPFNHGIRPSLFDFGMYYNVEAGAYDFGFAVPLEDGKVIVASYNDDGKLKETSTLAMIDTCNLASQKEGLVPSRILRHMVQARDSISVPRPSNPQTAPVTEPSEGDFTAPMANTFLTYMGSMYRGTDFFRQLTRFMERRRNIAKQDAPLTTMKTV